MPEAKLKLSPGEQFSDHPLEMKIPHLEFIYRLDCEMAKENHDVGAPYGGTHSRIIMPILGGTVKGPRISGIIQHKSGADWGTTVKGTDFMRLDARYTLKTDDSHLIYVRSKGVFSPNKADFFANGHPDSITQDDVDWFTRLQFETGSGPYNWMNGIMAIGVLSMYQGRIQIDAYRVTNFPDEEAKNLKANM